MSRPSTTGLATVALALTLLLAGCGSQSVTGSAGSALPSASDLPATVPAVPGQHCPLPQRERDSLPHLPDDVTPTSVVVCTEQARIVAGEGEWSFAVERRADHGLERLVAAMRRPDEPGNDRMACPAIAYLVTPFAFLDADGRLTQYAVPRSACGQPSVAVRTALDALPLVTVAETRLRQTRTPAQVESDARAQALGCAPQFKDMIAIEQSDGTDRRGPGGSPYRTAPAALTLCRYVVDQADPQVGRFVSGERLSGGRLTTVLAALEASGAGRTCAVPHTGFAALFGPADDYVLVETDGCGRVYADRVADAQDAYRVSQASPQLLAAIR